MVLDGVRGYPSSFTEEAFGGLVREIFSKEKLLDRVQINLKSIAYSGYRDDIIETIKSAEIH
ncbi:MAG: hypothetical protein ACI8Q6_002902 [Granulosicoccus sp.]